MCLTQIHCPLYHSLLQLEAEEAAAAAQGREYESACRERDRRSRALAAARKELAEVKRRQLLQVPSRGLIPSNAVAFQGQFIECCFKLLKYPDS